MPTRRLAAWHKPLVTSQPTSRASALESSVSATRHNRRALPGERRKTVPRPGQTEPSPLLKREDGIAMLTVLMLTLILTVIGLAAITSTSLDIKMAGGERVRESSVNAAEACMSSGGAAGGGIEILYRIDCYADSTAGGMAQAAGHIAGVYSCVSTGESCQRKI